MTQQITLIKDKILSDNYFTLHNITYDPRAKMAKLSAINVKFTIAVMVRRSSCTTRRKERGSDSSVPCRYGLMAMKAGS